MKKENLQNEIKKHYFILNRENGGAFSSIILTSDLPTAQAIYDVTWHDITPEKRDNQLTGFALVEAYLLSDICESEEEYNNLCEDLNLPIWNSQNNCLYETDNDEFKPTLIEEKYHKCAVCGQLHALDHDMYYVENIQQHDIRWEMYVCENCFCNDTNFYHCNECGKAFYADYKQVSEDGENIELYCEDCFKRLNLKEFED